ncbi:MAG: peptidoglycan DD-metalloendopeptidase family protein [Oleiphilaceae bacterium]|nr:peptidoglycan DD-metalloendopeptidase family protein [Oleiphilaceae bacterium]
MRFVTVCILVLGLLTACVSKDIYHDSSFNPPVYFGTHVVREGDTLYSIAWRYGRDFRELASTNNIAAPYTIVPGQKIDLERSDRGVSRSENRVTERAKTKVNVTESNRANEIRSNVTKIKKHKNFKDIKWSWPHLGPILAKYKNGAQPNTRSGVNKGIDIGGEMGDPIYAAASGEVVYAGSGLLGYGNLIIINHNALYLSAYAHNRRILVKEGQQIKRGQQIAEMGRSGVERTMLHFEIRRDGKPVDPLRYLPHR